MKATGDRIEMQAGDFRGSGCETGYTIGPAQQPAVTGAGGVGIAAQGEFDGCGVQPFAGHDGFELCATDPIQHVQGNAAGWGEMRRFMPDNAAF